MLQKSDSGMRGIVLPKPIPPDCQSGKLISVPKASARRRGSFFDSFRRARMAALPRRMSSRRLLYFAHGAFSCHGRRVCRPCLMGSNRSLKGEKTNAQVDRCCCCCLSFRNFGPGCVARPLNQPDSITTRVAFGCGPFRTRVAGVCVARTTKRQVRRCAVWGVGGVCRRWYY